MKVIQGDNIETLKKYPDNYFDAVVTDPPYGLGKEPDAVELMKDWIEHGYHEISGSGFMGKEWDAFVPQPLFWKEVFRVLKHGGHVLAFYGTRTFDWGVMAMRFAGFEVRDTIYWHYGSGFPKSHNIGKAIDKLHGAERDIIGQRHDILIKQAKDIKEGKRKILDSFNSGSPKRNNGFKNISAYVTAPATEEAKQWEGWGSALKPASEPIVLARKPLEKGLSIAENVMKWGTGGINIDGCRVGNGAKKWETPREGIWTTDIDAKAELIDNPQGRFPANLIMTHHPECECRGLKKIKAIKGGSGEATMNSGMGKNGIYGSYSHDKLGDNAGGVGDENGEETIEDWICHPDCPIKIMDEQSGILKSGAMDSVTKGGKFNVYGQMSERRVVNPPSEGGASRFFYCAKASKSERNKGLEGFEEKENKHSTYGIHSDEGLLHNGRNPENRSRTMSNFHPTVKPVKLMQYLVRLITPPNGKVLDPFCGSGTTGIACKLEGFEFVGLEQDAEYCKIAEARIKNYQEEKEELLLLKEDKNTNDSQLSLF